jgi:flagellar assembly factor FliW
MTASSFAPAPALGLLDAPGGDADATLRLDSDLLGTVEVPAQAAFEFPDGVLGFPGRRRFALVPAGREGLFWLQSVEDSALVFLLADPFRWMPSYEIDVPPAELAPLGVASESELAVLAIVTLPAAAGEPASVNLRAPLLLGTTTRRARQLVLASERYDIREPLALG